MFGSGKGKGNEKGHSKDKKSSKRRSPGLVVNIPIAGAVHPPQHPGQQQAHHHHHFAAAVLPAPQQEQFNVFHQQHNYPMEYPSLGQAPPPPQQHLQQARHHVGGNNLVYVGVPPPSQQDHPTEVLERLYLGSKRTASQLALLQQLGVTHVLNMAKECDNFFEGHPNANIEYLRANFRDFAWEDMYEFFPVAIAFIERGREGSNACLVHCNAGISRSSTVVIAYLMYKQGARLEDALGIVQAQHPDADPYNFKHHLELFEKYLDSLGHYAMAEQANTLGHERFNPPPLPLVPSAPPPPGGASTAAEPMAGSGQVLQVPPIGYPSRSSSPSPSPSPSPYPSPRPYGQGAYSQHQRQQHHLQQQQQQLTNRPPAEILPPPKAPQSSCCVIL